MSTRTRKMGGDERGFTLIELLVVILIIGVLAEIAIPSFLGQSSKAHNVSSISSLWTAQLAMDTYRTDHGSVCGATVDDLVAIEPTLTQEPSLVVSTCPRGDTNAFVVSDISDGTPPTAFRLTNTDGVDTRRCTPAGQGGCEPGGTW